MSHFFPGKIITSITDKNNQTVIIRYPKWEDLPQLCQYINKLSQEDTYITFSGEKISYQQETDFLSKLFTTIENQNQVSLVAVINNKIVAYCNVIRDLGHKKRSYHIGIFGLSVARDYRNFGIGYLLAKETIKEASQQIPDLKIIILQVYAPNQIAQNLYQKLGFKEYGRLPNGAWFHDSYVDIIKMYSDL